ncbi:zinc ABC transporter substrate-binding protein [Bacteroidia bacterium]|nr:zinc ABC transporter substrate-binding protein [Bacteroidia bacterium]
MKHKIYVAGVFAMICLVSCSTSIEQERRITVTIEPQRYFAEQLAGDLFEFTTMVPPGLSPESYDPTPQQMTQLAHSRAYFAIGKIGFENVWLDRLKENNPQTLFFDNSEGIDWIVAESHEEHSGHHHSAEDPHIWISPHEVQIIIRNMYHALVQLDPENAAVYQSNYEKLTKEIDEIASQVEEYLNRAPVKSFVIYHPALTYLARDYGLKQYAIENEGKEPSPEQLKSLVDRIKREKIRTVFIQQEFDRKNAEIIARETGCRLEPIYTLSYQWKEEMVRIAKILADE